jgi:hypothetical protein
MAKPEEQAALETRHKTKTKSNTKTQYRKLKG